MELSKDESWAARKDSSSRVKSATMQDVPNSGRPWLGWTPSASLKSRSTSALCLAEGIMQAIKDAKGRLLTK